MYALSGTSLWRIWYEIRVLVVDRRDENFGIRNIFQEDFLLESVGRVFRDHAQVGLLEIDCGIAKPKPNVVLPSADQKLDMQVGR